MLLVILSLLAHSPTVPMNCATPVFDQFKTGSMPARPESKKPANPPQLGEKRLFWLQNMSVMPPQQYQAEMTCRGIGPYCYVMIDDSVWNEGLVDSADVARIVEKFSFSSPRDSTRGVWQHSTEVLGFPPDAIDSDSAIYLLYYNVGTFRGIAFDGFWQFFDQYYDTTSMRRWSYHSNEVECVYIDCYPNNPSSDYRVAIAAHEFGHMIHWNYDEYEDIWVQEGFCELAMWLYGAPDPISSFPSNPDNDLTSWTGVWADYIKTYLWSLFLYEQYGGRIGNDLIHNIIASTATGIPGIDQGFETTGLPERFEQVFDQWVIANRVNDTTFEGGKYGYYGERVPNFAVSGYHTSYPVSRNADLNRYAGEYVLFQRGSGLELGFDGDDAGDFRLYLYAKDTVQGRAYLDTIALDANQQGSASVPGFDTAYQSVYLIPVNHNPAGKTAYAYQASVLGGIAEQGLPPVARPAGKPTVMRAAMLNALEPNARLFSADGQALRQKHGRPIPAGVFFVVSDQTPDKARRVVVVP